MELKIELLLVPIATGSKEVINVFIFVCVYFTCNQCRDKLGKGRASELRLGKWARAKANVL